MRASDADRDRVADRLREALAEGRITAEEHAERIDAVYRARTYAELEPVLHDLPAVPGAAAPAPAVSLRKEAEAAPPPPPQSSSLIAIFSGAERKGRWLVEPHTSATCVFGGIELDFRRAVLSQREVTVNITAIFGGVEITVPPGVRVVSSVATVFGGVEPVEDELDPDAPTIRLTGLVLFGGVSVRRREAGASRAALRRERREEHRRRHEERREERLAERRRERDERRDAR
ncbi:hypothetical protein BTM25_26070 [Actinomadura rubteroloni]|uniref:Uncharacterized protein n=1 Tax=Actinomadura rubteroloni TaxID=1926885 RepID=A0A2P4UG19_9ACTN|nr:hypothetical protein BTM25_26070 [Actinomadura rubteroloni]